MGELMLGLSIDARIKRVLDAPTDRFVELFCAYAGLDPTQDLRFCNWSDVDFSGSNLRGFDFTGANLSGCCFKDAQIVGARFDAAQVERAALRQAQDWQEYARSWTRLASAPVGRHLPDMAVFSDAPFAPEVVVIPAGGFLMGSPAGEEGRGDAEGPQHKVTVKPFAIGKYEVTFAEWDACVDAGGCSGYRPDDSGWGRGRQPVIDVSWQDAQAYVDWLAKETGKPYRLPSEAEWEYACRAGTETKYSFGYQITPKDANYSDSRVDKTTEVGSYAANPWGLYDMHGNVWEWVEDVWHANYKGAPADGLAWTDGEGKQSSHRDIRGGSWYNAPRYLGSAGRDRYHPGNRGNGNGFRVARTLD